MKNHIKAPILVFTLSCTLLFTPSRSFAEQPAAQELKSDSTISVDKAIQLAEIHLSLRNIRWGKPKEKGEEETRWVFAYDTPPAEQRVLGPRKVSVDKASGVVKIRGR